MTTETTTSLSEQVVTDGFEPQILCFACNWCSYAGADLAGATKSAAAPKTAVARPMTAFEEMDQDSDIHAWPKN